MKKLQFATYIRGTTETAVKYNVQFDMLDRLPAMTQNEYQQVKAVMRDRYSAPVAIPSSVPDPPAPSPSPVSPAPDEDPKPF
jgi:hypothetical protein